MKQALQHCSTAVVTPLPTSSSDNEALALPQFVLLTVHTKAGKLF